MNTNQEIATDLNNKISNFVNYISIQNDKLLGKELANDHPTLQQAKMRMFIAFCQELKFLKDKGICDLRNEAACMLASDIIKLANNHPLPFI